MARQVRSERTFDIDGPMVRCIELDDDRLWHCECPTFQEKLRRLHQGFCAHTAVASWRCLESEQNPDTNL